MPRIRSTRPPGNIPGKITSYNGTATAGAGLSPTVAYGSVLATSTSGTTIASFTAGASGGFFEVGGFLGVTAWTSGTVSIAISYTDSRGNARGYNLQGVTNGGSVIGNLGATGTLSGFAEGISVQANSTITIKTSISGTATADFYGFIRQVN